MTTYIGFSLTGNRSGDPPFFVGDEEDAEDDEEDEGESLAEEVEATDEVDEVDEDELEPDAEVVNVLSVSESLVVPSRLELPPSPLTFRPLTNEPL